MLFDSEFYNEPSEFDQIVDDLRLSLMQSVKKEFLERCNDWKKKMRNCVK